MWNSEPLPESGCPQISGIQAWHALSRPRHVASAGREVIHMVLWFLLLVVMLASASVIV